MTNEGPLPPEIAKLVESARERWPTLAIDPGEFARYVEERADGRALGDALRELRAADLLLAFACSRGDARALALFEGAFFADLERILARVTHDRAAIDELAQTLRAKLFVAKDGRPPAICEYSGRGDLRGFFRVTATRHAISALRRVRRDGPDDDDDALALTPSAAADPELRYLREHYRDEFRRAFDDAIATLPHADRNLLRYHYVDRLNIDEIGAILRIHRVSAARRLTKVRAALVDAVRAALRARLKVESTELRSILRLVKSEVDLSMRQVLGPKGQKPQKQKE